jgi:hypothetical protein
VLEIGGAVILVSILINWLLLIWLSASLLFISQPDSLMNVETNSPTVVNKIFYTGYTLSTLGLGDMEPEGNFWDIPDTFLYRTDFDFHCHNLFNSSSFSRDSKEKNKRYY